MRLTQRFQKFPFVEYLLLYESQWKYEVASEYLCVYMNAQCIIIIILLLLQYLNTVLFHNI